MYTYKIISTIKTHDHSDRINVGDVLCDGLGNGLDPEQDTYATSAEAIERGQDVINGLDGNRAFRLARDSAEVEAVTV